jgi:hypothetical protein
MVEESNKRPAYFSVYQAKTESILTNLTGLEAAMWNDGSGWNEGCWSDGGGWENSEWSNSDRGSED